MNWSPDIGVKPYYADKSSVIYHGDCREILPLLPKVDLVLTDPPYGEVNRESSGLRVLDKGVADVETFGHYDAIQGAIKGETAYVWCGTEQVSPLRAGFVEEGLSTRLCIWEKTNPSPMNGESLWLSSIECCVFARKAKAFFSEFCKSPVFRGPSESNQLHPTQKPLWLFQRLINASCPSGGTVLDFCMGSGTTLRAAKDLGRKCIGIELEEKYCAIAVERLRQEVLITV